MIYQRANNRFLIYLIEAINTDFYKIGVTSDIKGRLRALQTSCPHKLRLVCGTFTAIPTELERFFHSRYAEYRVIGEWFQFPKEILREVTIVMSLPREETEKLNLSSFQHKNQSHYERRLCLGADGKLTLKTFTPQIQYDDDGKRLYTKQGLTKKQLIKAVKDLRLAGKNFDYIKMVLWDAKPGGNKAYAQANADLKEVFNVEDLREITAELLEGIDII